MTKKDFKVWAIMHVAHENAGTFGNFLEFHDIKVKNFFAKDMDFKNLNPLEPDLLLVMGGPMGVYENESYQFLDPEIDFVRERLAADRPTLGICLGSQIMAKALGANVYKGVAGQEIGWSVLDFTEDSQNMPISFLRDTPVLHWHGDTFDLPKGATLLASSKKYKNQAFSYGRNALALQFHPEVSSDGLELWYIEDPKGVEVSGKSEEELRDDALRFSAKLAERNKKFFMSWLADVSPSFI